MKTINSILSQDQLKFVEDLSPAELNLRLISKSSNGAAIVACAEMVGLDAKFPCDRDLPFYVWQNLGGCIDDSTGLGAIVLEKEINDIVVFGHTGCGILEAGLGGCNAEHFSDEIYNQLLARTKETRQAAKERFGERFDQEVSIKASKDFVVRQLACLLSIDEIRERAEAGLLRVHSWVLNSETSELESFNPTTREFKVLSQYWS